jgi:beta-mannosidase
MKGWLKMEILGVEHGQWRLRAVGDALWIPTTVPGEVHVALMEAGRIPDPFISDDELLVQWVAETDWEFEGLIDVPESLMAQERVWLVFDGLDTLAEVSLNGKRLGEAENAFRTYAWEVRDLLRPGVNQILIWFKSPVKYVAPLQEERPLAGVEQAIPGGPYLRKAPCQWGWDWGPQLPPIGLWKGGRLAGYSDAKFESVHLRQAHRFDGSVEVWADGKIDQWSEAPLQLCLTLKDPSGKTFATTCRVMDREATAKVLIKEPVLWWPNGYGEQALYQAQVTLRKADETVLDLRDYQVGLRTLELRQEPDAFGESFRFVVNSVPIFAKGSNWIPADSFPTRVTRESLGRLLGDAARAHHNMIRVWGGGFYEDENFYDLCDQYGILVWQDLIFSCSIYPLDDPAFVENVRQEVIDNVRRIRHRASLALWCGNNEMDWGWESWGWSQGVWDELREPYRQFFYETLPGWLAALDPDTPYWYSSPSSGTPFEDCNSNHKGDAHYWEVWHGAKPFSAYREQTPRFMSEFGFQSLPPLKTIQYYADEAHWNLTDYIIEHHQRNAFASALFMGQMAQHFMMPADFPSLVYLTMVLQAEGIRYGVEHWRRSMHRVSGTLYWQLNDCWPVASWSSLDYFDRWKALHYASRRFYAPVLLSIEDDEGRAVMRIHLTNDLQTQWQGEIRWRLMRLDGEVLDAGVMSGSVAPSSSSQVFEKDFSHLSLQEKRETIFVAHLFSGGEVQATQLATFIRNKHLNLVNPQLKAYLHEGDGELVHIQVEARYLARFVELSLDDADVVFSDNYFDVLPGEAVRVELTKPEGWTLDDVGKSLTVFSLYDSFA